MGRPRKYTPEEAAELHRQRMRERSRRPEEKERQKAKRWRLYAEGKCVQCGKQREPSRLDKWYCFDCARYRSEKKRERKKRLTNSAE